MITLTENAEKKLHSIIKGENGAAFRVVVGPDQRLRLVIDRGSKAHSGHSLKAKAVNDAVLDSSGKNFLLKKR